jgi:hypothetical protein
VPRAATFGAASAPWDDFAAGVAAAPGARGESVGAAGAEDAGVSEVGDALEELGAELLLGFAVSLEAGHDSAPTGLHSRAQLLCILGASGANRSQ